MTLLTCAGCDRMKPDYAFGWSDYRKTGRVKYCHECLARQRKAQRARQLALVTERRAASKEWVAAWLKAYRESSGA